MLRAIATPLRKDPSRTTGDIGTEDDEYERIHPGGGWLLGPEFSAILSLLLAPGL